MLLGYGVLPLLGGLVGVHIEQLLSGYKEHVAAQLCRNKVIAGLEYIQRVAYAANYGSNSVLEGSKVAGIRGYDLLPVPLIHVYGVQVVQLFIAAYGVHIGIEAVAWVEVVAVKRHAFPLCERLHYLRILAGKWDIEAYRALIAVQVVVEACLRLYEQRCGYAFEVQCPRKAVLKFTLYEAYSVLSFIK